MKALITGCAGFLGSHLAELLLGKGYAVHGLLEHREHRRNLATFQSRIALLECDVRQADGVSEAIEQIRPDEIYHLAAISSVPCSLEQPQRTYETNTLGTLHVLEAARRFAPTARVLYVSTAQVYKESSSGRPLTEEAATDPQTPYAASKACGELLARQYHANFGLDVVVVRPFNSIGPRQSPRFACADLARQMAGIALGRRRPVLSTGDLSRQRDFTDARDLVRAFWSVLQEGRAGETYNICSGIPHSLEEAVQFLAGLVPVEVRIESDPKRMRSVDPVKIVGDSSKLRQRTAWRPAIEFRQSLEDLFEYWKSAEASPSAVEA